MVPVLPGVFFDNATGSLLVDKQGDNSDSLSGCARTESGLDTTPASAASDAHRSEVPVSVEEPLSSRPIADHLTTDMPLPATADDQVDGADMNDMNDSVLEKKDISKTYLCIFCQENFQHSRPGDVWIQCQTCENWCHEECADIRSGCYFTCDLCK
ncbi:tigger transposable element-derived protein [Plakobranchus ocellatus]|uniref:Tigger transposable element-derived protein n=1 Tax=Plakobranchus ocellatus TaxID=259542 RepID=A0AAV4BYB8_9GAST|nr:tigger transposable element-derived protein [Plakobranchus ocellatus]